MKSGDRHVVDRHRRTDPDCSRGLRLPRDRRRPDKLADPQDRPSSRGHVRRVCRPAGEAASTVLDPGLAFPRSPDSDASTIVRFATGSRTKPGTPRNLARGWPARTPSPPPTHCPPKARRTSHPRLTAWRGDGCYLTAGHHRPGGSGEVRPASAAAPGSVRTREGAALADAPGREPPPSFPADAIGLVVLPVSGHAFPLGQLAPFRAVAGLSSALACRRRALEPVEKVVTGPAAAGCTVPLDALHGGFA